MILCEAILSSGDWILTFSPEEKTTIDLCANDINKSMIELIIDLNRASSIKIWNRTDYYNY